MPTSATFVIKNAKIFTSDENNPRAEAVAVKANRIVYVGNDQGVFLFLAEKYAWIRIISLRNFLLLFILPAIAFYATW